MNIKDIKKEKSKVIISVSLEGTEWTKVLNKHVDNATKNLKIDGFRKGKVPASKAKNFIDMNSVLLRAANQAISETIVNVDKNDKVKELDVEVYPTPSAEVTDISENSLSYQLIYWMTPKVTIDDYKNLDVDLDIPTVTKKEIDHEIEGLLNREKMLKPKKDGVIAKGDQVDFDFTGFLDGKEFEGGKAKNFKLEIGSNQFIPGFEDAMIGLKVNEEKDLDLTFPKDYHAKNLAGKAVVFKVKINNVNEVQKPQLDEKFVKSLEFKDVNTVKELEKFIEDSIIDAKKQHSNQQNIMKLNQVIFKKAKYDEIPPVMIEEEAKKIKEQYDEQLKQMRLKEADFLNMVRKTKEDINNEILTQAKSNVVVYGALDYIIGKENIKVSDEDIKNRYKVLADAYNTNINDVKKTIDEEGLREILSHEEVLLKLIDWNANNGKKSSKKDKEESESNSSTSSKSKAEPAKKKAKK